MSSWVSWNCSITFTLISLKNTASNLEKYFSTVIVKIISLCPKMTSLNNNYAKPLERYCFNIWTLLLYLLLGVLGAKKKRFRVWYLVLAHGIALVSSIKKSIMTIFIFSNGHHEYIARLLDVSNLFGLLYLCKWAKI